MDEKQFKQGGNLHNQQTIYSDSIEISSINTICDIQKTELCFDILEVN